MLGISYRLSVTANSSCGFSFLSGDLDLQPRVSAARAGTHSSSAAKARRYFYFFHGLPPLIPIKWIMSACGHENLPMSPGEIWDWVILYFSLIPPSDFPYCNH